MQAQRLAAAAVAVVSLLSSCSRPERVQSTDGFLQPFPDRGIFGDVALHKTSSLVLGLENVGRAPLVIEEVHVEGQGEDFEFVAEDLLHRSLTAGESLPFRIRFRPVSAGPRTATVVVISDATQQRETRFTLTGNGIYAAALIDKDVLDFGRIEIQSSRTLDLLLENRSTLPADLDLAMVGADREMFKSHGPKHLEAGEKGVISVTFSPTREGQMIAGLAVTPCEGCDPQGVVLKGTGILSALAFEPDPLDFKAIAVDQSVERPVLVRNVSDLPATVKLLRFKQGSDVAFTLVSGPTPITLAPDETVASTVRFTPSHLKQHDATLEAFTGSAFRPTVEGKVKGSGGGAEIAVTPDRVDFGELPVGAKHGATLRVRNMGAANVAALKVTSFAQTGDKQFNFTLPRTPLELKAGEFVDVPVFYEPTQPGAAHAVLIVRSSDGGSPEVYVNVTGSAHAIPPCKPKITPMKIDFGTVIPGRIATLGFRVENAGTDLCAVKNLDLENTAGELFYLSGNVPPGYELKPGDWFVRHVAFKGTTTDGRYSGHVRFEISDPVNPKIDIPVSVNVQFSCLALTPKYVNWGVVAKNCPPEPVTINVVNQCGNRNIDVTGIVLGEGTAPDFQITQMPVTPMVLKPGEQTSVTVAYLAKVLGESLVPLYVRTPSLGEAQVVPLSGETSSDELTRDRYTQQDGNKIDVLFVVDNSESMVEEQPRLKAAIPGFIASARAQGVDMNIGVTTTGLLANRNGSVCPGGADGGENGRLFPVDGSRPRLLTLNTPSVESLLQDNTQVGYCHFFEQGLEAMKRALSSPLVDSADDLRTTIARDGNLGFYRSEAALAVVFVSDEDDHSGDDVDSYVKFLRGLKGVNQPQRVSAYAIASTGTSCGTAAGIAARYLDLARQTGGQVYDICSADFTPALKAVAQKAFGPQSTFNLTRQPDAAGVKVYVNSSEVTTGWKYDAAQNAVVFDAGSRPASGARVTLVYSAVCVKR